MKVIPFRSIGSQTGGELVELSVRKTDFFKMVGVELEKRPPDEGAAEALIAAYRSERAPPWLTAYLLGCNGHRLGYETARSILLAGLRQGSEDYAGIAMGKIAGEEALSDLMDILETGESGHIREGAANGLGVINHQKAKDALIDVLRRNLLPWIKVASIMAEQEWSAQELLGLLKSKSIREVRAACGVVHLHLGESKPIPASSEIARAVETVLNRPDVQMHPHKRKELEKWASDERRQTESSL